MVAPKRKLVTVRTTFVAIHCWPQAASINNSFLRNKHRHKFYVEVKVEVKGSDREIEFFDLLNAVNKAIGPWGGETNHSYMGDLEALSCEDVAEYIARDLDTEYPPCKGKVREVSVFEDNENGVTLEF